MDDLRQRFGRTQLSEREAKQILQEHDIPTVTEAFAETAADAAAKAREIGLPVVVKIDSPDIGHKTDVGGIMVIEADQGVEERIQHMKDRVQEKRPDATIDGFLVEEKAHGSEFILGINTDPQFGKVVVFGLGGVYVELFRDISLRLVPVDRDEIYRMIDELESKPLLEGFRGSQETDIDALVDVIAKVAQLAADHDEIKEMDINPLFIDGNTITAVDALITLEDDES